MLRLNGPGNRQLDYFLCQSCGSAIQHLQDGNFAKTIYQGVQEENALYTVCLRCGDRQRARSNLAYQSYKKHRVPDHMTPKEVVEDCTLETAMMACPFKNCASNQEGSVIVNRVKIYHVSEDSLKRRFTCCTCKSQWV